jgi:hypothetical protein
MAMPDNHHIAIDHKPNLLLWDDGSCSFVVHPASLSAGPLSVPLVPPLTWPATLFDDVVISEARDEPRMAKKRTRKVRLTRRGSGKAVR